MEEEDGTVKKDKGESCTVESDEWRKSTSNWDEERVKKSESEKMEGGR